MKEELKKPHRVQWYEWRTGKVLPKPRTIAEIENEEEREELALIAVRKYLPFIKTKNKLLKVWKEIK